MQPRLLTAGTSEKANHGVTSGWPTIRPRSRLEHSVFLPMRCHPQRRSTSAFADADLSRRICPENSRSIPKRLSSRPERSEVEGSAVVPSPPSSFSSLRVEPRFMPDCGCSSNSKPANTFGLATTRPRSRPRHSVSRPTRCHPDPERREGEGSAVVLHASKPAHTSGLATIQAEPFSLALRRFSGSILFWVSNPGPRRNRTISRPVSPVAAQDKYFHV